MDQGHCRFQFLRALERFNAERLRDRKCCDSVVFLLDLAQFEVCACLAFIPEETSRPAASWLRARDAEILIFPNSGLRYRERSFSQLHHICRRPLFVSVKLKKFCSLGKSTPVEGVVLHGQEANAGEHKLDMGACWDLQTLSRRRCGRPGSMSP
jgi:hypothetical protein